MNLWARALLGILFGASLTLAVHPVARQFLWGALHLSSPRFVAGVANNRPDTLPPPTSTIAAAIWLQIACEKALSGQGHLSPKEIKTLISLAKEGAKIDTQNAFWLQMAAVFESYADQAKESKEDWIKASHCLNWNDLQTRRLLQMRAQLADNGGWHEAWTYGYVYFARSDAPAVAIGRLAQSLVSKYDVTDPEGLKIRYATICNGSLLRDGSRSIRVGYNGVEMVELATYPPSLTTTMKGYKRRLWVAQTTMTAKLREANLTEESKNADYIFGQNEAWLALIQRQSPEDDLRSICLVAVAVSVLPGSLMICAFIGLLLLVAMKSGTRIQDVDRFKPALLCPLAIFAAGLVAWTTGVLVAGLIFGASIAFLLVNPKNVRRAHENRFGPMFSFTVFAIWLLATTAASIFLLSSSTAGEALLPMLGPTGEYLADSKLFLAITMITLSLVFLIGPTYALMCKQPTPLVLHRSLSRFGLYSAIGALILCALSGPVSVYGDKLCGQELQKIVENEPNYYLLR